MNLEELKAWWRLYSVKLAAFVSAATAVLTANPELVTGLIAVIPVEPLPRLIMAGGVGVFVFLIPIIARVWPQNVEKSDGDETDPA